MGDWNFLGGILEEVHIHSTIIGKIWLTILFIFRMLVLGVATEDVWNDEQSEFICNTEQPGCRNVCYDEAFPISLIRYWVLQVIFVSSPSLVYMGHALYRLRALEKERQKKKAQVRVELESTELEMTENRKRLERELRQLDQKKLNKAPLRGSLLCTYVIHIFTRSAVEVGFMIGQYLLYGFHLDPLYKCQRDPCPNTVDCFVSRPTEKTVFILFMQSIATVSLLLNILEITHLGFRKIKMGLCEQNKNKDDSDNFYINKSKKYSLIPHSSFGISTTPQKTLPCALSSYTFLMEKQTDTMLYPVLNSPSMFRSAQNNRTKSSSNYTHCNQENKSPKRPATNALDSQTQNTSTSNNEGFLGELWTETHDAQKEAEKKHFLFVTQNANTASNMYLRSFAEMPSQTSLQPDTTFSSTSFRRQAMVGSTGAPTNSLPKNSDRRQSSFSVNKAKIPYNADVKNSSLPDTSDSMGEVSSESTQSRVWNSPKLFALSRQLSLSSNASNKRAPTDLQI
ncbi:gap junction alpha-9 protein [Corvus hawaiiensis]|uniref:gap junction alpha-9 protein n=1 Tax=Corvus hawaiiensis TaxID=134902 RepID=UPI002018DC6F|nr:gap junction alpha-9 protein [Corvus hawaiiensis]XP_048182738.1 gap junction alpha-9 protein [Corvus hawaiiensis]